MLFMDRVDAGRRLAGRLGPLRERSPVVLGLPRGGVPVAAEVAEALGAPLDVCLVRKLGVPYQPELGMGAIGEDGVRVVNDDVVRRSGVSPAELAAVEERERAVLTERAARYRGERPPEPLAGRTVVLVDDGVATGSTARAACRIARARGAARIVLAVPVAPPRWTAVLAGEADELIALETPADFAAVGQFYTDFAQTSDDEVVGALRRAARQLPGTAPPHNGTGTGNGAGNGMGRVDPPDTEVWIPVGAARLGGTLAVPAGATGAVLFAHGSGSGRHSPRNRRVAAGLGRAGLATLLLDLLTVPEAADRALVFDTELLAGRLSAATRWLLARPGCRELAIGYFGASTGAAAALWAAAETGSPCAAVVSRGGRPDLAAARLPAVTAPTLLLVGGADHRVLELNRWARDRLRCENRLLVIEGAGHLFAEPGTLEQVTDAAAEWFTGHLVRP
ncbi:phosphoribosyltransferase family protein [Streptomyces yaizuensis]|uniref:Phosphoribosyltransferase n=1 Tax=Streptomyces yaizuensis TaxID=2989713 RepID=A0ABQ5NS56_9ACTN|nr:phosphoribosyltransferase family protein [Streptomyces sp. YSPA8]GLF93207.1 phosphoribosyltransferase [Streptomyces sp. YSPA8]